MSSENICIAEPRFKPRVLIVHQLGEFTVEFLEFGIKAKNADRYVALTKAFTKMVERMVSGKLDWKICSKDSLEFWIGGEPVRNDWKVELDIQNIRWRIEGLDIRTFLLT